MLPSIEKLKGIHPGAILKREIKKRGIKNNQLASAISEYPQTLNAITKERRGINPKLSYKLGEYFSLDHDYFMLLQAAYEVKQYKRNNIKDDKRLMSLFNPSLFWDTKTELIDIERHKRFIIQRIFERGTHEEIQSLKELWSVDEIKSEIEKIGDSHIPGYKENTQRFLNDPE